MGRVGMISPVGSGRVIPREAILASTWTPRAPILRAWRLTDLTNMTSVPHVAVTTYSNCMKLRRAEEVRRVLSQLYPHPPIPLNHSDTFTFLVAVVLSAQTTDGRVNDVTKVLFQKAPTPERLSKLSVSEVLEIIAPVGLAARKAQYLVQLSQKILQDFDGKVPSTHEGLETLPGVGNKTASVIMSQVTPLASTCLILFPQAFGEPALAVDTHVHRLANRWGLSKESNVDKVQADLCSLFPKSDWNEVCFLILSPLTAALRSTCR